MGRLERQAIRDAHEKQLERLPEEAQKKIVRAIEIKQRRRRKGKRSLQQRRPWE